MEVDSSPRPMAAPPLASLGGLPSPASLEMPSPTSPGKPPGDSPQGVKRQVTLAAIADWLLVNPAASKQALANAFGYTLAGMSIIVQSDAFQGVLAERRAQLVDPIVAASLEAKLRGMAADAVDLLATRVQKGDASNDELIKAAQLAVKTIGNTPAPAAGVDLSSLAERVRNLSAPGTTLRVGIEVSSPP